MVFLVFILPISTYYFNSEQLSGYFSLDQSKIACHSNKKTIEFFESLKYRLRIEIIGVLLPIKILIA